METETSISLRGIVLILAGVFGGAWALSVLTTFCWPLFIPESNGIIGPGVMMFTLPKGAFLGFLTGYSAELHLTGHTSKAARLCIGWGGWILAAFAVILFVPGVSTSSKSVLLAWDAFTILWCIGLLFSGITLKKRRQ